MSGHGNRSDVLAEISKELVTAAVSAWRGELSDTVPELGIGSAEESDGVLECGADSEIFFSWRGAAGCPQGKCQQGYG